jgi:hypothetical protein
MRYHGFTNYSGPSMEQPPETNMNETHEEEGLVAPESDASPDAPSADSSKPDSISDWAARLRAVPIGEGDEGAAAPEDFPAPPERVREAASLVPDHWLGVVDPMWAEDEEPPEWAIAGQWRSDSRGEIVEWRDNENYTPSPMMRGWDEPADPLEAAIQLSVTGYGPAEDVTDLLNSAELAVLVDAEGAPVRAAAPDGTPVVPAFSSEPHLEGMGVLQHQVLHVRDLVPLLADGLQLCINPAAPVTYIVDPGTIVPAPEAPDEEEPARTSTS